MANGSFNTNLGSVHYSVNVHLAPLTAYNCPLAKIAGSGNSEFTTLPLTIYSNPNSGQFQARFWAPQGQPVRLQLVDLYGHTVQERSLAGEGRYQEVSFNVPNEVGSMLFLHVQVGTNKEKRKILIKR